MVGPNIREKGMFMPISEITVCIPVSEASRLESREQLLDEDSMFHRTVAPLASIGRAAIDFAVRKGIKAHWGWTGHYYLFGLDSTNIRVQRGQRQVVSQGCMGEPAIGKENVSEVAECPNDPEEQCIGCYKKLISRIEDDRSRALPDDSIEVAEYQQALSDLAEPNNAGVEDKDKKMRVAKAGNDLLRSLLINMQEK